MAPEKNEKPIQAGDARQVFYQCQRCGNCCRWPGFVRLSDSDVTALAQEMNLSVAEFTRQYTRLHPNRSWLVLENQPDGACVFLEGRNHCRVQAAKPTQCRGFPNGWRFPGWREVCEAIEIPQPSEA